MAGQPLAEAYVRIDLDTREFDRAFAGTQAAFKSGAAAISQTAKSMQMAVVAAFGAMTAAALSMKKAVSEARDFDKAMREVWTLMDVSEAEMRDLSKTVSLIGVKYGETATKALKAFYQITSASFSGAEGMKVLDTAMKAAIAGITDVFTAADALTSVLNAYSLRASDAERISDIMFQTVKRGKTTMDELAGSIGRLTGIAAPAGVTFEELGAAIATLTRGGLSTEEAVTALRAAIVEIEKPSEPLLKIIQDLGYETGVAAIKAEGFFPLLSKIAARAEEAGVPLTDLFGNIRSLTAVLPLAGDQAREVANDLEAMKNAGGSTAEAFEKMAGSIDFEMRRLGASVGYLWRSIGDLFATSVASMAGSLSRLFTSLAKTIDQSEEFRNSLQYILKEGLKLGALIAVLGGIFLALKMLLTPTGALLAAFSALYLAVRWNLLNIGEFLEQLGQKVTGAVSFVLEFAGLEDFAEQIRSLGSSVERAIGMAVAGFAGSILVRWLLRGLTKPSAFIGVLPLAGAIAFELAMRWKKVTANAEQLANLITDTLGTVLGALVGFKLGGPWGAIFGAAAGRLLAEGIELAIPLVLKFFSRGEQSEVKQYLAALQHELDTWINSLSIAAQMGLEKVKLALNEIVPSLSEALRSPEAQANWEAVLETLRGYFENVKTVIASALPPEEAEKVGRQFAENLIGAVQDEKFKDLIEEIFRDWLSVSDEVKGQAEQTGKELGQAIQKGLASVDFVPELNVSAALSKAADLGKRMGAQLTDSLNDALGDFKLSVGFTTPPWLLDLLMKQEGGFVPGKGTGDRVPALLEPGEFVWPKELVRKYPEVIVGLWRRFRLGGFVGYQAGGTVLAGGGANQISGLAQGISRFLDMLDRLVSGMYDFLKPLVKGEENLAKFEADFEALRNVIEGLRQAAGDTSNVFDTLMQQTENQVQAIINQADQMAEAGQAATDLAAKLEAIKFPSAEAGKELRRLALESGHSAEDLIAIHAKALDLIDIGRQLYEAQKFFGFSTEETIKKLRAFLETLGLSKDRVQEIMKEIIGSVSGLAAELEKLAFPSAEAGKRLRELATKSELSAEDLIAVHRKAQELITTARELYEAQQFFGLSTKETIAALREFLSSLGLSEAQIETVIADIVGQSEDLVSAFRDLIRQAEDLTLAQSGQILALRQQALAVLESGKVVTEEGEVRQATIGELMAAAGAVGSFASWLDSTITILERLITKGNEAVRPLYERLTKLKESLALGPTFEEQRRAQEQAAEEAKRRQEELARKAREAFEESFQEPIKRAFETGDWMEAALAVREMAKQKDDLVAQAKALPAVQGKTMELAEVYDLLIGAQRELLSSIDKEIAVRQIAGENVEELEKLKTRIEELFDPLGEWKKALREAAGLIAEDPQKASQALRELFLKAKELGAGGAEAASLIAEGARDQIRAYEAQIENLELFGLSAADVHFKLEVFKNTLTGMPESLAKFKAALDLYAEDVVNLVGTVFGPEVGEIARKAGELARAWFALDSAKMAEAGEEFAQGSLAAGAAAFAAAGGLKFLNDAVGLGKALFDALSVAQREMEEATQAAASELKNLAEDAIGRFRDKVEDAVSSLRNLIESTEAYSGVQRRLSDLEKGVFDLLFRPLELVSAVLYEMLKALGLVEEESERAAETAVRIAKETFEALNVPAGFKGARYEWAAARPGEPYRPIEEASEETAETVTETLTWAEKIVKKFGKELGEALAGLKEFRKALEETWKALGPAILRGFLPAVKDIGRWFAKLGDHIRSDLLPVLTRTLPDILAGFLRFFGGRLVAAATFVSDLFAGISPSFAGFAQALGSLAEPMIQLAGQIAEGLSPVLNSLLEGLTLLIDWVGETLIPALENWFSLIGEWWNSDVAPFLSEKLFPQLQEWLADLVDFLGDEVLPFLTGPFWDFVENRLWPRFEGTVKKIFDFLEQHWPEIEELIETGVEQWLTDLERQIELGAVGILVQAGDYWGALESLWQANSISLWEKVKYTFGIGLSWLTDAIGGVVNWIGSLIGGAVSAIGNFFGWVGSLVGLQAGGIVTCPTLAWLGEAGPEAVIPLTGFSYPRLGLAAAGASISIEVEGRLVGDGRELVGVIERVRARDEIVRGKR